MPVTLWVKGSNQTKRGLFKIKENMDSFILKSPLLVWFGLNLFIRVISGILISFSEKLMRIPLITLMNRFSPFISISAPL